MPTPCKLPCVLVTFYALKGRRCESNSKWFMCCYYILYVMCASRFLHGKSNNDKKKRRVCVTLRKQHWHCHGPMPYHMQGYSSEVDDCRSLLPWNGSAQNSFEQMPSPSWLFAAQGQWNPVKSHRRATVLSTVQNRVEGGGRRRKRMGDTSAVGGF